MEAWPLMVWLLSTRVETMRRYGAEILDGRWDEVRPEVLPDAGLRFEPTLGNAPRLGVRIESTHVPTRMRWDAPAEVTIPDFEGSYFLNVSERARRLIESMEPARHQFLPVRYETPAGVPIERRYVFVVCNRIDSVDHARTTMIMWRGIAWASVYDLRASHPEDIPFGTDLKQPSRLVFSESQIGDRHAWVDPFLTESPHVSDRLAQAIKEAALTGVALSKQESVQ